MLRGFIFGLASLWFSFALAYGLQDCLHDTILSGRQRIAVALLLAAAATPPWPALNNVEFVD